MILKYLSIITAIVGVGIGSFGTLTITKAVKPKIEIPACPACNCPPATEVRLQTLDMDALKKIKGDFTYSPQLSNVTLRIDCQDSLLLKELMRK